MILTVYSDTPPFPATDQHPDATRYRVGTYVVDAIGGVPTEAAIAAFLAPPSSIGPATDEVATLRAALAEQTRRLDDILASIASAKMR